MILKRETAPVKEKSSVAFLFLDDNTVILSSWPLTLINASIYYLISQRHQPLSNELNRNKREAKSTGERHKATLKKEKRKVTD